MIGFSCTNLTGKIAPYGAAEPFMRTNMIKEIKGLQIASGFDEIRLPGEHSLTLMEKNCHHGIELPDPVYRELLELGKPYGLLLEHLPRRVSAPPRPRSVDMAVCAMAEALYSFELLANGEAGPSRVWT